MEIYFAVSNQFIQSNWSNSTYIAKSSGLSIYIVSIIFHARIILLNSVLPESYWYVPYSHLLLKYISWIRYCATLVDIMDMPVLIWMSYYCDSGYLDPNSLWLRIFLSCHSCKNSVLTWNRSIVIGTWSQSRISKQNELFVCSQNRRKCTVYYLS